MSRAYSGCVPGTCKGGKVYLLRREAYTYHTDHVSCTSDCSVCHFLVHNSVPTYLPIGGCNVELLMYDTSTPLELTTPGLKGLVYCQPQSFAGQPLFSPSVRNHSIHISTVDKDTYLFLLKELLVQWNNWGQQVFP